MGVERPDWLPAGWRVHVKVRTSGKKDKYYVNSSKGLTLSSKPEVLRYLKSSGKDVKLKGSGKDVKLKASGKDDKPKEVTKSNIQKTVAENLPPGWIKEVRSRKKGSKKKSDTYYIDPISGRQFRSMQEVFRYLESKDLEEHAKSKSDVRDHVSIKLGYASKSSSAGAKGQRSTDKNADKSLTGKRSVKSGLERSRFAVGLKDGPKANVSMPTEQGGEDDAPATELSDKLVDLFQKLADRKSRRKKLADNRVDKSADKDQISKSDQRSKSGSKVKNQDTPIQEHGDNKHDCVGGDLPHKLRQVNANEQVEGGRRQSMRLTVRKQKDKSLRSAFAGSGEAAKKIIIPSESDMLEEKVKENNSTGDSQQQHESPSYNKKRKTLNNKQYESPSYNNKRKTLNSKSASDLPHRKPKRIAREEIDLPSQSPEIKTSKQSGALAASLPAGKSEEVTAAKNNISRSGPSDKPQIVTFARKNSNEHKHSKCALEYYSTKSEEKPNKPSLPAGELEVTTAKNKEIGRSGPSNKPQSDTTAHENSKEHNHSKCGPENSTKNEEKPNKPSPPAVELEVTTAKNNIGRSGPSTKPQIGTTAHKNSMEHNLSKCRQENSTKNEEKPVISHDGKEDEKPGQKPEMNPKSAMNDLLRDPCIEFAVKTLTGAIPIEEVNKVGRNPVSSSLSSLHVSSTSSSNKSASGNIWADPCFEFAAKILTGEVPVKDDGSQLRIAFQQPRDPSLDNVYPLDTFSQFAGVKNAWERQQGVKDPSLVRDCGPALKDTKREL
ncbi:methyl-CPG-binding domain protein 13 [Striga asiatica]|uniref:Methyl-CPG-binding domain protein 13 n=1 Tax=Striga asiatica TaxID=4170 RepID=A0A5A7PQ89_STRAF|nr:methyl-CPG-binding domain protein 13 [Striga asiatica]